MRILLVHNRYRSGMPGGEDRVFDQERQGLLNCGHEVFDYQRSNDELFSPDYKKKINAFSRIVFPSLVRDELGALIRRCKPEIIHAHNLFPFIGTSIFDICEANSIPLVQTIHNYRWSCVLGTHHRDGRICTECIPTDYRPAIRYGCYRRSRVLTAISGYRNKQIWQQAAISKRTSRFIALTQFLAACLKNAGIEAHKIVVRPNYIHHLNKDIKTTEKKHYVIYSGRLSPEKGVITLLKAWGFLQDIPLVVMGDGPMRAEVTRFISENQLNVKMIGYQKPDAVAMWIKNAALQVVPSEWYEGMPLVVLEAWAAGTPVIGAEVGALAEMIDVGVTGELFRPSDPWSLACAVRRVYSDSALSERLIAGGRARFDRDHSVSQGIKSLEDIYLGVINQSAR